MDVRVTFAIFEILVLLDFFVSSMFVSMNFQKLIRTRYAIFIKCDTGKIAIVRPLCAPPPLKMAIFTSSCGKIRRSREVRQSRRTNYCALGRQGRTSFLQDPFPAGRLDIYGQFLPKQETRGGLRSSTGRCRLWSVPAAVDFLPIS